MILPSKLFSCEIKSDKDNLIFDFGTVTETINYTGSLEDIVSKIPISNPTEDLIKENNIEFIRKRTRKPIHMIGVQKIIVSNIKKTYKKKIYEERSKLYDNNSLEMTKYLYQFYFYKKNFTKTKVGLLKDFGPENYGFDYFNENHQRINMLAALYTPWNDTDICGLDIIKEIEDINYDFLINTKWPITPLVLNAAKKHKLPIGLRRSQIIAISNLLVADLDMEIITSSNLDKERKDYQKKYQSKIDLRKTKDIIKLTEFIYAKTLNKR